MTFQIGISQERSCGTPEKMQELLGNPKMQLKYQKNKDASEVELKKTNSNKNNALLPTLRIPVAVHYPSVSSGASATLKNCLRTLAQNQIDVLNADFNASNADLATWTNTTSSYFPGVSNGSLNVVFEIASGDHPTSTGLTDGTPAVTFGQTFGGGPDGDWDPDWSGYLNLVVKNLSGGTLGYAYLASSPIDGAAVFIDNGAFGTGAGCTGYVPGAPYNLGRTLTHELGHYLNLDHIWGDATCGDDFVADTPEHNTSNGGCPAITHLSTCTGTPRELTMNYMDYTNDSCMYMLTAGQAARMQAHINTIQLAFNQSTLSNDNFSLEKSIGFYPNPSNGKFNIQLPSFVTDYSIRVIDQSGRLVLDADYSSNGDLENSFDLKSPQAGIYYVTVKTSNAVATKKIIIE